MKIEFGCGDRPRRKDFKTCDIRDIPGVDFVCPAWEIENIVDKNSVDEIFSYHFFEHLTFAQGELVLNSWFNILRSGGKCEMRLPNIDFHINQWINKTDLEHAQAGFWGWQREGISEFWDVHKSGYNTETLTKLIKSIGFNNIRNLKREMYRDLHFIFYKP